MTGFAYSPNSHKGRNPMAITATPAKPASAGAVAGTTTAAKSPAPSNAAPAEANPQAPIAQELSGATTAASLTLLQAQVDELVTTTIDAAESRAKKFRTALVALFWKAVARVQGWSWKSKAVAFVVLLIIVLHFWGPSRDQTYSMMPPLPSVPTWANMEDVNHRVEAAKPEIIKEVKTSIEQNVPTKSDFAALQDEVDILRGERDSLDARLRKLEAEPLPSPKRRR